MDLLVFSGAYFLFLCIHSPLPSTTPGVRGLVTPAYKRGFLECSGRRKAWVFCQCQWFRRGRGPTVLSRGVIEGEVTEVCQERVLEPTLRAGGGAFWRRRYPLCQPSLCIHSIRHRPDSYTTPLIANSKQTRIGRRIPPVIQRKKQVSPFKHFPAPLLPGSKNHFQKKL